MFNRNDRMGLVRVESKMDLLANRVSILESKQIAHEAICDEREREYQRYVENSRREEERAQSEWARFTQESRSDRQTLREKMDSSHAALLWKLLSGTLVIIATTVGAIVTLLEHGVIKP